MGYSQQAAQLVVRITASHPDYEAIALSMHLLGVSVNPQCWYGEAPPTAPEWIAQSAMLRAELDNLFVDYRFKELTDGLA